MVNTRARAQQSEYQLILKYQDYNKNAYLDVHVRVFQIIVKVNGKTLEEYIINAFSYTLKKMASNWCNNYMLEFFNYNFLKLTQAFCKRHQKTQNDDQIYMELKNIKQGKIE